MKRIHPTLRRRNIFACLATAFLTFTYAADAGVVQYGYDELGRLISVIYADGSSVAYNYDPAGNRTQVVQTSTTVDFTANPPSITSGYSAALTWSSSNITGASIDQGVGTVSPASGGSVNVSPMTSTTYTLTATLPGGGIVPRQATVTVLPPASGTFTANPPYILAGGSASLTWSSNNTTSASIDHGIGNVTPVSGGSVSISTSTATTYTLTLTNSLGNSVTKQATVAINRAPSAVNDSINTNENTATTFNPRTNDSDPDDDTFSISAVSTPPHGSASVNSGATITYTPALNYYGSDSFTYTISDGRGGTATASVSVTVNFVNQPPVANNDAIERVPGAQTFDPRSNDSDPEGDPLTITSVTTPSVGTVTIVNNGTQLSYTGVLLPGAWTTFSYTISDGHGHIATAQVTMYKPERPGGECVGPAC